MIDAIKEKDNTSIMRKNAVLLSFVLFCPNEGGGEGPVQIFCHISERGIFGE